MAQNAQERLSRNQSHHSGKRENKDKTGFSSSLPVFAVALRHTRFLSKQNTQQSTQAAIKPINSMAWGGCSASHR
jgi:hypothetical protein